jgi:hypothetical protein
LRCAVLVGRHNQLHGDHEDGGLKQEVTAETLGEKGGDEQEERDEDDSQRSDVKISLDVRYSETSREKVSYA